MIWGEQWNCDCDWANVFVRKKCRHCGKSAPTASAPTPPAAPVAGEEGLRDDIASTLRAAGGLHNPDDAGTLADAILPLLAARDAEAYRIGIQHGQIAELDFAARDAARSAEGLSLRMSTELRAFLKECAEDGTLRPNNQNLLDAFADIATLLSRDAAHTARIAEVTRAYEQMNDALLKACDEIATLRAGIAAAPLLPNSTGGLET